MPDHPLSRPIQFCAGIVLVLAVLCSVAIALNRGQLPPRITESVIPAALILAAGAALCGILLGVTALIENDRTDPATKRLLTEIRDHLARSSIPLATEIAPPPARLDLPAAESTQVLRLLEEIRDITLLDEGQRKQRLEQLMAARRQAASATVETLVKEGKWLEARTAIEQTANLFGDGPELSTLRAQVFSGMTAAEQAEFTQLQQHVRDLQAADQWDKAIADSEKFIHRFPDSGRGIEYHTQLVQARDANIEATANRLFEEIRIHIEQRSWRQALGSAQRMVAKCPGHPKTQRIQSQMDVIRQNADTEQRNAMEARIRELVKAGRVKEAIEIGEDLIRAYPLSPQAEITSQLILKLRERMDQQNAQTV